MEVDPVSGKKRRMVVVVMDECHLGIGRGGQMDVLVNGTAHGRSGVECNPERILMEDKVYVVYVSATGWNCMPGVLPEKTVMWSEDPVGYTGWKSYAVEGGRNRDRLCSAEGYQHMLDYFKLVFRGEKGVDSKMFALLPSLVLMVDYGLGFMGSHRCSEETQRIVADCGDGTTVVRVQPNGAQGAMVRWLRYFLGADDDGAGARVETSVDALRKVKELERSFCVLVEKSRYGDSFPPGRLLHYDLRARYQSATCTFSSLLQDVGRCFGYRAKGEAPLIVLSPKGHRLFMGQEVNVVDRYLNKQGEAHCNSMWFNKARERESFKRRWVLLLAQPQVGKTGVYLRLLEMVVKERLVTSGMTE